MDNEIIKNIVRKLKSSQIDAIVLSSPDNVTYTVGYEVPSQIFPIRERLVFCIINADGKNIMLVPNMEFSLARDSSSFSDIREYNEFTQKPTAVLYDILDEIGVARGCIAIEDDFIPGLYLSDIYNSLSGSCILPAKPMMSELRTIKTPGEIDQLRRVNQIAENAHYYAAKRARAGISEFQIAKLIYEHLFSEGVDRISELIVGSGERSEYANAFPTARILKEGDIVRTDILPKINGYQADVARTAVVGDPSSEQQAKWAYLIEARSIILNMIKPGVRTGEIYQAFKKSFERAGLTPIDFVGHGLGITIHEDPYISCFHDIELQPGMVLAIEPLFLTRGEGYHVEDVVAVTENGYDLFTASEDPSQLIHIEA
jgi:Xaa-Pro aminopeptidase